MGKRNEILTDEQVEIEIERLLNSEEVRLAKKETRIKQRRRQYMWSLRSMEKRGKELKKMGVTLDNMEHKLFGEPIEDGEE
jgi:hypothetical protein